jgi:hypothetical protein
MPAPYRLNIFDQFGNPSKTLDQREIQKCSEAQLAVLFPTLDAWTETQTADAACAQAEADKRKADTALGKAEKALEDVTPKWTAHMEWQRTVAKMQMPEQDPAITKKIASATKARDAAQGHLANCIAAIFPAKQLRDEKRAIFADRLREWSKVDGSPKSVGDLIKERVRVENDQKLANIAAGLPVDYTVAAVSSVGDSHLDRFKAGGGVGHRGSINQGYNRSAMRGATPR